MKFILMNFNLKLCNHFCVPFNKASVSSTVPLSLTLQKESPLKKIKNKKKMYLLDSFVPFSHSSYPILPKILRFLKQVLK